MNAFGTKPQRLPATKVSWHMIIGINMATNQYIKYGNKSKINEVRYISFERVK